LIKKQLLHSSSGYWVVGLTHTEFTKHTWTCNQNYAPARIIWSGQARYSGMHFYGPIILNSDWFSSDSRGNERGESSASGFLYKKPYASWSAPSHGRRPRRTFLTSHVGKVASSQCTRSPSGAYGVYRRSGAWRDLTLIALILMLTAQRYRLAETLPVMSPPDTEFSSIPTTGMAPQTAPASAGAVTVYTSLWYVFWCLSALRLV